MIITSSSYMQTRALEQSLAGLMLAVGLVLLLPGDTLATPLFGILTRWMGEVVGGSFLLAAGSLRTAALIINGRWRSSPIARIAGCLIGSGFWFTFAVSVGTIGRAEGLGVPVLFAVSGWAFLAEAYSALRCGTDAEALDSLRLRQSRSKVKTGGI